MKPFKLFIPVISYIVFPILTLWTLYTWAAFQSYGMLTKYMKKLHPRKEFDADDVGFAIFFCAVWPITIPVLAFASGSVKLPGWIDELIKNAADKVNKNDDN